MHIIGEKVVRLYYPQLDIVHLYT